MASTPSTPSTPQSNQSNQSKFEIGEIVILILPRTPIEVTVIDKRYDMFVNVDTNIMDTSSRWGYKIDFETSYDFIGESLLRKKPQRGTMSMRELMQSLTTTNPTRSTPCR